MSDDDDSWVETTLGIEVQGILGTGQETATAVLEPTSAFRFLPAKVTTTPNRQAIRPIPLQQIQVRANSALFMKQYYVR